MKISVAGSMMHDEIVPLKGRPKESYGGIVYNVVALAETCGREVTIVPICHSGSGDIPEFKKRYFDKYPQVVTDGVVPFPKGSNRNTLTYLTEDVREERMRPVTPPFDFDMISPHFDSDLILVNFITGSEFSLGLLDRIRRDFGGIVAMDLHNMCRRVDESGKLTLRDPQDWTEWIRRVDYLQANEEEFAHLAGFECRNPEECSEAITGILAQGPSYVVATFASRGSLLAYRDTEGSYLVRMPSIKPRVMRDPTGCGDWFSAGFLRAILFGQTPPMALAYATAAASLNCEVYGVGRLGEDGSIEKRLSSGLGDTVNRIQSGWKGEEIQLTQRSS
jgi:sugar/nucleoside kinase (ribokinase family)